ncbi:hypothetical protein [Vibrio sp. D431a]|uniref:hypothetical protein n=1 Tax=Vibrio sp. D431a TaxID=2837388 RepID=UPI0025577BE4|nr:hypothetical protein [Vibrio sp. D431a]MDK9793795.1 hypothetical protein [Vibrio sp. D431a]
MKPSFTSYEITNFSNQKGTNIGFSHDHHSHVLNVFVDNTECPTTLRVCHNDDSSAIILTNVSNDEYKEPVVAFSEDKAYCYVTFRNVELHVKIDDESLVFDVWDKTNDECIDTNTLGYEDIEEHTRIVEKDYFAYGFTHDDVEELMDSFDDAMAALDKPKQQ